MNRQEAVLSSAVALTFGYAVVSSLQWVAVPRTYLLVVALPGLFMAMSILRQSARPARRSWPASAASADAAANDGDDPTAWRAELRYLFWVSGLVAAIWLIGFMYGAALFTFVYLFAGARKNWPVCLVSALVMYALLETAYRLLHFSLPPSVLERWLFY